jgi:hypothetical protein
VARYEITYITRGDSQNAHERITNVWGAFGKMSVQEAIQRIESHQDTFYVSKDGLMVDVVVAVSRCGNKYIKTNPDGYAPNNLLSLPECSSMTAVSHSSFQSNILLLQLQLQLSQLRLQLQ